MEVGARLSALRQLKQLRADLGQVRHDLQRLRESAWPDHAGSGGMPCGDNLSFEIMEPDKAQPWACGPLSRLANSCYLRSFAALFVGHGGDGADFCVTEAQVAQLVKSGDFLVCAQKSSEADYWLGCCAVSRCLTPGGKASGMGEVAVLAVPAACSRRGVAGELLRRAEELLATKYQCGSVRVRYYRALASTGFDLQRWFEQHGYGVGGGEEATCEAAVEWHEQSLAVGVESVTMTKAFPVGFVSRCLIKGMESREEQLVAELARVEAEHRELLASAQQQGSAEGEEQPGRSSTEQWALLMPPDLWPAVIPCLHMRDVGSLASSCKMMNQEAEDPELWRRLFLDSSWPPCPSLLEFSERMAAEDPEQLDWRKLLRGRQEALPSIVVDWGRGYSKYGLVHGLSGRLQGQTLTPTLVQLCSSPTHPPDCDRSELLLFIHSAVDKILRRAATNPSAPLHQVATSDEVPLSPGRYALLKDIGGHGAFRGTMVQLRRRDAGTGRWLVDQVRTVQPRERPGYDPDMDEEDSDDGSHSVPSTPSRSRCPPQPAAQCLQVEPQHLRPVRRALDLPLVLGEPFWAVGERSGWTHEVQRQLAQLGERPGPVFIAPQAQMALWAHGSDHGIVVNIGQQETIALPVVRGVLQASAGSTLTVGSGFLTQRMLSLLSSRHPFITNSHMTWSRDLKERHCYVAPPQLFARDGMDAASVPSVTVDPSSAGLPGPSFELREERVLVPELGFFPQGRRASLQGLIVNCAERVLQSAPDDRESVRALLRNIVLVGGAAELPGIRARTEHEVRAQLKNGGASPQLRAALASCEDAFVLQPPMIGSRPLFTPRFGPFLGGCVRAAGAGSMGAGEGGRPGLLSRLVPRAPQPRGRAWSLVHLNAPAIFRMGGGGGADEDLRALWGEDLQDEDTSDEEDSPDAPFGDSGMDQEEEAVPQVPSSRSALPFRPPPRR